MACEIKIRAIMNKPSTSGKTILDLSKIIMYEFHYDYMKPKYGGNFGCVTWTLTPWFMTLRLMISTKTSLVVLTLGST